MKKLGALREYLDAHGKEDKLLEILQGLYQDFSEDTMIGFFFTGKDLNAIVQGQKKLLMTALGYSESYTGKAVHSAHLNLPPIRRGQFFRRIKILEGKLKTLGLPDTAISEWVNFETQFEKILVKE